MRQILRIAVATMFGMVIGVIRAFAAPPAVDVRLTLDDSTVLPATPTGITVTVENHGDKALQLPAFLWLVAIKGESKALRLQRLAAVAPNHDADAVAALIPVENRTLLPGAAREFRFDSSIDVAASPWFMDEQLWVPGQYRLRAIFAPEVTADGSYAADASVLSNEQPLTVSVPSGDDAAVWQWMQQNHWNGQSWAYAARQLADFILKDHPKSEYALFAAFYFPVVDDRPVPAYEELLVRYPNKSFTDRLKLRRIYYYQQSSYVAYRHGDLYRAANDAETARGLATTLMETSRASTVRASAKDFLQHIPTRQQLMQKQVDH